MVMMLSMLAVLLLGVGLIVMAVRSNRRAAVMEERLANFTEGTLSLEELELQLPFRERVLAPMAKSLLNVLGKASLGKNAEKVRHNLEMAGNPNGLSPAMFVGMRIVLMCALFGVFLGLTTIGGLPLINRLMYTAVGASLGYTLPGIWLGRKIKARKANILKSMPDALDLLTISVEAGLGFDLALQRVIDKWDTELSREFNRVISDTRLGVPRRDSMRAMADRCDVEDLSNFVSALVQAEQLGVSIGKILKVQSEQMRIRRRQRAEELANAAPLKMLFPMAFLIFPTILVIILGPAVPRFMSGGP
ncbi:MAG: Type II/IV secretion system protein TadC, associated with Flp pilus assembly, partial [uncultured Chloroflexia bacterium]